MDSDICYQGVSRPPNWEQIKEDYVYEKGGKYADEEAEFYFEQGADAMYNAIESAILARELTPNTITNVLNDYGLCIWVVIKKKSDDDNS